MASPCEGSGRRYHSPRRAEQARRTRQRILAAARDEFLASGWVGTTMRAVAAAAGVSLPAVEQAFGTKANLLKEVIDVAIAGDDEPVPVLGRPWAAEAAAETSVPGFLDHVAAVLAEAQWRSARLVVVAEEAAGADPALRSVVEQRRSDRAGTAGWIADGVLARLPASARLDRAAAVDTVWLLMEPVLFSRLTGHRGWSAERYRRWFADSVARLLTTDGEEPSAWRG